MNSSPYGHFSPELNNLLNRLGCYAQDRQLDAKTMERLVNAGIAAAAQFEPKLRGASDEPAECRPASFDFFILAGPQGAGKSQRAAEIAALLGATEIVDGWDGETPIPPNALLILNSLEAPALLSGQRSDSRHAPRGTAR